MAMRKLVLAIGPTLSCSGCAVYPLPQDVAGFDTDKIIANVRCEARDAVRDAAIVHLRRFAGAVTKTETGIELADKLDKNRHLFEKMTIDNLTGDAHRIFAYYKNTQVSYDFSLQGMESNTQGYSLGLSRTFGLRKDGLGFGNELGRTRDITRSFFIWDKFEKLIKIGNDYCESGKSINIVYPIVGILPISDLMLSYISANRFGILVRDKSAGGDQIAGTNKAPAVPQMGDTISFKTKISGSMSPNFNYNPVGPGLLVSSLTLKNENSREDTHRVIVTVSTADQPLTQKLRPGEVSTVTASDESRLAAAQAANGYQRGKRLDDAIISIGTNISRLTQ